MGSAGPIKQFGTINVTNAREHCLVHQQSSDGRVGLAYIGDARGRVSIRRERVGARRASTACHCSSVKTETSVAPRNSSQSVAVDPRMRRMPFTSGKGILPSVKSPKRPRWMCSFDPGRSRRPGACRGRSQIWLTAGQQRGAGEAAIQRFHADGLAHKGRGVQLGPAVYLTSLRHVWFPSLGQPLRRAAHSMLAGERPGSGAAAHTSFRKGKASGNIIPKIAVMLFWFRL